MSSRDIHSERLVNKLTQGSITKSILTLAVPLIISNTFSISLELTDAFFVGKLGSSALAAVSLAGVVIFFLATFGIGLGFGVVALISRAFGERDFDQADRIVVQAFYVGLLIAVTLAVSGFFISPMLLKLMGAQTEVLATGTTYLKILFAGIFTMFFMFLGNSVFQGIGDTKTPMKIWGLTVVLNIILDAVLIFGLFGFPRLEVAGAALGTVLSRTAGSLAMVYRLLVYKNSLIKIKKEHIAFNFGIVKKIFYIGIPASIQMFMRSLSLVILMKIAALFGTVVVAAYGIGGRLYHLLLFPGFAIGGATATLTGQNLGARNVARAKQIAWLSTLYYFLFLLIVGTFMFVFSSQIAALFNPEQEFIAITSVFLRYLAAASLFLATGMILARALQGAGNTILPMLITGLSLFAVQIPLAILLSNHFGLKETGIWIASFLGIATQGILMIFVFYFSKEFKEKDIQDIPESPPVATDDYPIV